jgi:hypothetical protein
VFTIPETTLVVFNIAGQRGASIVNNPSCFGVLYQHALLTHQQLKMNKTKRASILQVEAFIMAMLTADYFEAVDRRSLVTFSVPARFTVIGPSVFARLEQLKHVDLNNVQCIKEMAFEGSGLTSITIGSSVTHVGEAAFERCKDLRLVAIEGNPVLGRGCFAYTGIQKVLFPNLKNIPSRAFFGCPMLSLMLPATLESIGEEAFSQTLLGRVEATACSKLRKIEKRAFWDADLSMVFLGCRLEYIGAEAFGDNADLYALSLGDSRCIHTVDTVYLSEDESRHPRVVIQVLAELYPNINVITIGGFKKTRHLADKTMYFNEIEHH